MEASERLTTGLPSVGDVVEAGKSLLAVATSWWTEEEVVAPAPTSTPVVSVGLEWWGGYATEPDWRTRKRMAYALCDAGQIDAVIAALPEDVGGLQLAKYEEELDEVLDMVQLHGTQAESGMNVTQMGQTQADYLTE